MKKSMAVLFREFEDAAKNWGYTEDSGYGPSVAASRKNFNEARTDLVKAIERLERKAAKAV